MNRTKQATSDFMNASGASSYDIGICGERGMLPGHSDLCIDAVMDRLSFLRFRNAQGEHIYIRPAGEHACTLLDDLDAEAIKRLHQDGFSPAAVVETSPNNFQAWLRHTAVLSKALSTLAARKLAERFGGDPGSADWRHFGRMPGFTNPKPKHRRANGQAPFVLLRSQSGTIFRVATSFRVEIERDLTEQVARREEGTLACRRTLSPPWGRRSSLLSLPRFRDLPRFAGQPAAADLAFCVAAFSEGLSPEAIERALTTYYLSRDPDPRRRLAYVNRTIVRARQEAGA